MAEDLKKSTELMNNEVKNLKNNIHELENINKTQKVD